MRQLFLNRTRADDPTLAKRAAAYRKNLLFGNKDYYINIVVSQEPLWIIGTEMKRVKTEEFVPILSQIKKRISETSAGRLIFLIISGAHLYGFPSKDSDIDFRGCFIADTNHLLGLNRPKDTISSVNPDFQLFELEKEIKLALKGNFNVLEHIFSKPIYTTPEHKHLSNLVYDSLAKKGVYESYRGMAAFNYKKFILGGKQTYKKYLYVFRGLMAGRYFLETSVIQPSLEKLNSVYKFPEIKRLIKAKKERDERTIIDDMDSGGLDGLIQYCYEKIDEAYKRCSLPELPDKKAIKELNSFLVQNRKKLLQN